VAVFRKAHPDLGKGDWSDAMVIAGRLRFGRLPEEGYLDEHYHLLRRLMCLPKHVVDTILREGSAWGLTARSRVHDALIRSRPT
jgi:hypothetical protein